MASPENRKVEGGLKYLVVSKEDRNTYTDNVVKEFDDSMSALSHAEQLSNKEGVKEVFVARCFRAFRKELRVVEVSYS